MLQVTRRHSGQVHLLRQRRGAGTKSQLDVARYFAPSFQLGGAIRFRIDQCQLRYQSTDTAVQRKRNDRIPPGVAVNLPPSTSKSATKTGTAATAPSLDKVEAADTDATSETKGEASSNNASLNAVSGSASTSTLHANAHEKETLATKSLSASSSSSSSPPTEKERSASKIQQPLLTRVWTKVKHEASHYWSGTKLLGKEIRISARLQWKLLRGKQLTRREKRQLKRTTTDLLRLIPFIPFVIIPFMEFLLPIALKIFPNMLPSTFENKHAADEKKRKLLKVRLEMAKFLQETVRESGLARTPDKIKNSDEFKKFFRKVRSTGEQPSTDDIVKVAHLFEDDLTLDNLSRPQLVSMCRYMNINAFGTDNFLRYTIRSRLEHIGRDDKLIDAEGVDSLSSSEIAHACVSRGIRTSNIASERQKDELAQWIDLHLHRNLSGVLLILSKAFAFTERADGTTDHLTSLKDTLSSLPDTLLNETELQVSDEQAFKQRLEVLQEQEELIEDEAEQEQEEEEARKTRKEAEQEEKEILAARQAEEDAQKERQMVEHEKGRAKEMLPEAQVTQMEAQEAKEANDFKAVKMTHEQLSELGEALFILSAKSSVVREREDLAKLMEENKPTTEEHAERIETGATSNNGEPETRKISSLERRIQKMLGTIDEQLQAYDQEVSDKLNKFECPDGKISIKNLRTAFEQINHRPDDDTITALIDKLDVDHDGFVPLEDVTSLAEVEGIGVVIDDAGDQLLGQTQEIMQDEGLAGRKESTQASSSKVSHQKSREGDNSSASISSQASKKEKLKREEIVE